MAMSLVNSAKWIIPALLFVGAIFWHLHTVPTTPIEEVIQEKVDEIFFGGTLANEVAVDTTVETANTETEISSPGIVWTSDTNGYIFYEDSGGGLSMSSTTDSGATWSAARNVDSVNTTDVVSYAVWWEGWTPGTTTTRYIHIGTIDLGVDDTYYTRLDTQTGAFTTTVLGTTQSATCTEGSSCYMSITMTATGTLYMAGSDASDNWIVSCFTYSTCSTASNWNERTGHGWPLGDDWPILLPIPGNNNLLLLARDITASSIIANVYSATSSTWFQTAPVTLVSAIESNTTYDTQTFSATLSTTTGFIYFSTLDDAEEYVTADHDVDIYSYSTTTWTSSALTSSSLNAPGLIGTKLAYDSKNNTIYSIFGLRTTIGTATTGGIYYKTSTDGGTTWSATSTMVNDNTDDINGLTTNIISYDRIGVTWNYTTAPRADQQYYDDIVDLDTVGGGGGGTPAVYKNNVIWLD